MAFDGMMIHAIVNELQPLVKGRLIKIYQPYERDLVFHIRSERVNYQLLISANPTYPRIHITTENFHNPKEAPMFCMLLRKHLEGGIIENIQQIDNERIIHIDVRSRDELGDIVYKRLIIEVMGKHSNIILVDPDKMAIIDGIHHVSQSMNQYRVILPGREYVSPPQQNKLHPFDATEHEVMSKLNFNLGKLDKQIVDTYTGVSPLLAKEIIHQAGLPNREQVAKIFVSIVQRIKQKQYEPAIMLNDSKSFFYLFPLEHVRGEVSTYETLSSMLQHFFQDKAQRDRLKQKANDLLKFLANEKQKLEKKVEKLYATIEESKKAESYQLWGELLTAYMHQVNRGDTSITVPNYYSEENVEIEIPLNPEQSPNENAQAYFKKYNKLKKAKEEALKQIEIAQMDVTYLDTLLHQLENASPQEIEDIREELVEGRYIKDRSKNKKRKRKDEKPQLDTFESSEGIPIYCGKNNKQNEYLTNRLANSNDTWLHTKDIPGSHVVIRAANFSEQTLHEAAQIAAYYSKARHSSQVPVDYTLIKHVRKPSGAKPGYVIYEQQKTIYVTPDEEVVSELKKK